MIMQENRSFDSYFGTYPGANGIPAGVCEPDPLNGGCVAPFHDPSNENYGGPHGHGAFTADLDGGKMDGFVGQAEKGRNARAPNPVQSVQRRRRSATCIDAMGYHDAREIPNYWTYAENFVLQDDMFESDSFVELARAPLRWSRLGRLRARTDSDPMACVNAIEQPESAKNSIPEQPLRGRTSLTCCTRLV